MPGSRDPKWPHPVSSSGNVRCKQTPNGLDGSYLEREGYVVLSGCFDKGTGDVCGRSLQARSGAKSPQNLTGMHPSDMGEENVAGQSTEKGSVMMNGLSLRDELVSTDLRAGRRKRSAHIHKTEELAASFDGFGVFLDPSQDSSVMAPHRSGAPKLQEFPCKSRTFECPCV